VIHTNGRRRQQELNDFNVAVVARFVQRCPSVVVEAVDRRAFCEQLFHQGCVALNARLLELCLALIVFPVDVPRNLPGRTTTESTNGCKKKKSVGINDWNDLYVRR
jgi:hypothetical protein